MACRDNREMTASALPFISVIIPTPEVSDISPTLTAIRAADYPADKIEVIRVVGRHPARQRNLAAVRARGDILYFLDDDSVASPGLFRRAADWFADPSVWGVCGPNLAPEKGERPFAVAVDLIWTSAVGVGPKRARYSAVGQAREASDADMIGCNLAVRAESFGAVRGFDERVAPEEENDLVERLRAANPAGRLCYDPELVVRRGRPDRLGFYLRKIWRYGLGRAMRMGLSPAFWSGPGAIPAALAAYCTLLPFSWMAAGQGAWEPHLGLNWAALPALLYLAAACVAAAFLTWRRGAAPSAGLWLALLLPLTHLAYGAGQWAAILVRRSPINRPDHPVEVLPSIPGNR